MQGNVTIVAARPGFGRAGKVRVSVDGAVVGKLRQGSSLDVALEAGSHRFRVSSGGCRSKIVDIAVVEDGQRVLDTGVHQGLLPAVGICAAGLGYFGGILLVVPLLAILIATPGSWLYLRAARVGLAAAEDDAAGDPEQIATAAGAPGEMWWVNDPNLAKRYRKP
jgi:hypothetical protein